MFRCTFFDPRIDLISWGRPQKLVEQSQITCHPRSRITYKYGLFLGSQCHPSGSQYIYSSGTKSGHAADWSVWFSPRVNFCLPVCLSVCLSVCLCTVPPRNRKFCSRLMTDDVLRMSQIYLKESSATFTIESWHPLCRNSHRNSSTKPPKWRSWSQYVVPLGTKVDLLRSYCCNIPKNTKYASWLVIPNRKQQQHWCD